MINAARISSVTEEKRRDVKEMPIELNYMFFLSQRRVSNMRRTYRSKVNNLDMAVWSALQRVREERRAGEGDIEDKSVLTALLEEELSDEEVRTIHFEQFLKMISFLRCVIKLVGKSV